MYKKIKHTIALVCGLTLAACADSYDGLEVIHTDDIAPQKVTVTEVIPQSGALEIHFELSKVDKDIAQIVASYTKNGKKREFTASRYVSSILVEGFMGSDEQTIELQVVDNSGNLSEVTKVKGTPLKSPVEEAFEALQADAAFGGVRIAWKNITGDYLAIHVLTDDTLQIKGQAVFMEDPTKVIYTRDTVAANTFAYIRTYPPVEQKFGFAITDKWGNRTDTLITNLIPIREDHVDSKKIKIINEYGFQYTNGKSLDYDREGFLDTEKTYPKDGLFYAAWAGPATLFNGVVSGYEMYICKFIKNFLDDDPDNDEIVQSVFATYDLKCDVRLGRFHIWWRPADTWKNSAVRRWRFWGTTDANQARLAQFPEGWDLIGEYQVKDPLNPGNPTADEKAMWADGFEFNILDDNLNPEANPAAAVRYLRIELLDSFTPTSNFYTLNELEFWGEISQTYK